MPKDDGFYAWAEEKHNTVKIEIRATKSGTIKKIFRLGGKIITQPVLSGNTLTIGIQTGVAKKQITIDVKSGRQTTKNIG